MESLLQALRVPVDTAVYKALVNTDRKHFVPTKLQPIAYEDAPQPIGYNATISAPHMHLFACNCLHDHLKDTKYDRYVKVLDVGSGSGFLVAAFARLLQTVLGGNRFTVVGVEHIDALAKQSQENLMKDLDHDLLNHIKVHCGDGYKGWREEAPFDFIHVGAACETVPEALKEQLRVGGVMVLPVAAGTMGFQYMQVLEKTDSGQMVSVGEQLPVAYVPLTDVQSQLGRI